MLTAVTRSNTCSGSASGSKAPKTLISKSTRSNTTVDDLLTNAMTALVFATEFGSLMPLPLVSTLIQTAQVIVSAAQIVRKNKRDCAELGSRTAKLAQLIREQVHGREDLMDDRLRLALEQLSCLFLEIRDFVLDQSRLGTFGRLGKRGSIAAKVAEFTGKLDFEMRLLQTASGIRRELRIEEIARTDNFQANQLVVMNTQARLERKYHEDGQFRVYRLGDIHLLHQFPLHVPQDAMVVKEYYKAKIKGRTATVIMTRMTCTRASDNSGANLSADISVLKRLRHPKVAQLEGYSDPSDVHFFVIKGDLIPLSLHMDSIPASERGSESLRILLGLEEPIDYLHHQHGCWTLTQLDDLMMDVEHRQVVLGTSGKLFPFTFQTIVMRIVGHFTDVPRRIWQECISQRALSFEEAILLWAIPVATCSQWHEAVIYTGYNGPLYLYAGIAAVNCRSGTLDAALFEYMEFTNTEPEKKYLHWPPAISITSSGVPSSESSVQWDEKEAIPSSQDIYLHSVVYRVECDVDSTKQYLGRNCIALCKKRNVHMNDIRIVERNEFVYEAVLHGNSSGNEHPPIYFHISPMDGSSIPEPWGYFSFDKEPVENGKDTLMTPCSQPSSTSEFQSTLPGVVAYVRVKVTAKFLHLTPFQADALRYIYGIFHPEDVADNKPDGGAHVEEIVES